VQNSSRSNNTNAQYEMQPMSMRQNNNGGNGGQQVNISFEGPAEENHNFGQQEFMGLENKMAIQGPDNGVRYTDRA